MLFTFTYPLFLNIFVFPKSLTDEISREKCSANKSWIENLKEMAEN